MKLQKILESSNLAADLSDDKLIEIGNDVVTGYETDLESRKPWEKDLKNWTELALQVASDKTFPWPNAANIKYPLLATAAMQFAARAYPTLIPSNGKVVKCKVILIQHCCNIFAAYFATWFVENVDAKSFFYPKQNCINIAVMRCPGIFESKTRNLIPVQST
jgi:hypothetical protein